MRWKRLRWARIFRRAKADPAPGGNAIAVTLQAPFRFAIGGTMVETAASVMVGTKGVVAVQAADFNAANTTLPTAAFTGRAQQGPRPYLVCRFRGYDDACSLAPQRIVGASVSAMGCERPADFSLEQFDGDGRCGFGAGTKIKLRFRVTKEA